jgi:ribosomal protein S6
MPFYEAIIVAKAGRAQPTSNLMKAVSEEIFRNGGNVRNITILGDRILSRSLRGSDSVRYNVGRYVQILFDANPDMILEVQRKARGNVETLRVNTFKIKDFYNEAEVFKRSAKFTSPLINHAERNSKFLKALHHFEQKDKEEKDKYRDTN